MPIKSDRELIESYAMERNDAAFAELVAHYSPMVYRACLRVLGNASDAEDATQAAFLVLARKAGSLRQEGRLNGWLHRVARQVALQALRVRADRERRQEHVAVSQESMTVDTPEVDREVVFQAVDAELDGLSAILREAIVLRYLRGFSEQAAASAAGCPLGTMKRRASEGIAKLRQRLAKRGVALGGVALAGLLTSEASAAVPETLLPSILAAVKTAVATTATAAGATSTAAMLAKGAMKAMFIEKVKMVAAMAAAVVVTGVAVPVGIAASFSAGSSNHTVTNAHDAAVVRPEPAPRAPVTNGDTNGLFITAKSSEVDNITHCAAYEGDVHVTTTQFAITADRVLAFSENTNQLRRIEAFGNVVFRQPDRQFTCDKAVYEKADGKVTLTGKTVLTATTAVTRGKDSITASELVIDLNDNHVTASGGSKVQVHP
jgi:RNA polymerase sigma-70 factor (ECF subfamily)